MLANNPNYQKNSSDKTIISPEHFKSAEMNRALGYVCLSNVNPNNFVDTITEVSYEELVVRNEKLVRELGQAYLELAMANTAIEETNKLIFVDKLSGCYNRAYFENFVKEFNQTSRYNEVGIIYTDLNDLKQTNDTYGHKKGDELIIGMSEFLKSNFRNEDTVIRMGGDEFVVICRNYDKSSNFKDNLLSRFEEIKSSKDAPESAWGLAVYDEFKDSNIKETLDRADNLMFEDKNKTKNNVKLNRQFGAKVISLSDWKRTKNSLITKTNNFTVV